MYYVFLNEEGQHAETPAFNAEAEMLGFIARRIAECHPAKVYYRVIKGHELVLEEVQMATALRVKSYYGDNRTHP